MNTNRNKMGGVGIYLVVIAVIAVLYFALARLSQQFPVGCPERICIQRVNQAEFRSADRCTLYYQDGQRRGTVKCFRCA